MLAYSYYSAKLNLKPSLLSQDTTRVQYGGNQKRDLLAILDPMFERATKISAFSIKRPCVACRDAESTLMDIGLEKLVEIDAVRGRDLRQVLSDPNSYAWGESVATPFVPTFGFRFEEAGPLAMLLVAPLYDEQDRVVNTAKIGQGRFLLPSEQADPSKTFVIFNDSIVKIVSLYDDVKQSPSGGTRP